MTGRPHIEGYLIQSTEISSSTDVLRANLISFNNPLPRFPQARRSCRIVNPLYYRPAIIQYVAPPRPVVMPRCDPVAPVLPPISIKNHTRPHPEALSTRTAMLCVLVIFISSVFALMSVYASFPNLTDQERAHIRIPWNIEQAKQLGMVLDHYKHDHYFQVLVGVFVTYIFLQTFAIPGSLFLSILSGFLFPFVGALILVCTCSALGASLCFMLSQLLGRKLVLKYFPERAKKWAVIVTKQRDNLFNYVVFLRVTPFLPNWFINLTAPVIGVPLKPFALGTFFGVAPPSFVAIQTGQTLHTMSSTDSAFSLTSIFLLAVFAVISLVPIFLKQRLKAKFE